jgi:hypothetical protein
MSMFRCVSFIIATFLSFNMTFFRFNRTQILSQRVGCYADGYTFSNKTTGSCPVLAFVSLSLKILFIIIQGKYCNSGVLVQTEGL